MYQRFPMGSPLDSNDRTSNPREASLPKYQEGHPDWEILAIQCVAKLLLRAAR